MLNKKKVTTDINSDYLKTPRSLLFKMGLSSEAKVVWQSLADNRTGWEPSIDQIKDHAELTSKRKTIRALAELEAKKLIRVERPGHRMKNLYEVLSPLVDSKSGPLVDSSQEVITPNIINESSKEVRRNSLKSGRRSPVATKTRFETDKNPWPQDPQGDRLRSRLKMEDDNERHRRSQK
jgi:hypothetical protein